MKRKTTFTQGALLIAQERNRQISKEDWTEEHDDEHLDGELATAGAVYAMPPEIRDKHLLDTTLAYELWPWDMKWFRPKDRKRDLVRAGALIAAELDKLLREARNQ